jgi:hypothetical protein
VADAVMEEAVVVGTAVSSSDAWGGGGSAMSNRVRADIVTWPLKRRA